MRTQTVICKERRAQGKKGWRKSGYHHGSGGVCVCAENLPTVNFLTQKCDKEVTVDRTMVCLILQGENKKWLYLMSIILKAGVY